MNKRLLKPITSIFVAAIIVMSLCANSFARGKGKSEDFNDWDDAPYSAEEEIDYDDCDDCDDDDDGNHDDDWDDGPYQEEVDAFADALNPDRNYLIVVNDDHKYKFGGDYDKALKKDLVYIDDYCGNPILIEKAAGEAFELLRRDLAERGIDIGIYSAYRTKKEQKKVYKKYSKREGWCETNYVPKPGYSEHHTGLLLDIVVWWPEVNDWATETLERTVQDPEFFCIVHESLADYGFIDRYPARSEDITGYPGEPYEIRFVGSSETAHAISDNMLCLEEYTGLD